MCLPRESCQCPLHQESALHLARNCRGADDTSCSEGYSKAAVRRSQGELSYPNPHVRVAGATGGAIFCTTSPVCSRGHVLFAPRNGLLCGQGIALARRG